MKKLIYLALTLFVLVPVTQEARAQQDQKTGYYLKFDDVSGLFTEREDVMLLERFYLHNFADGKSSKSLHEQINAMDEVVKFGIASSAEEYSNQRRCYLKLPKDNHLSAFKSVLKAIPVDYVLVKGERLSVNEFIQTLKS
jgi:hypothetical protein